MSPAWSFAGWYSRRDGVLSGPFPPEHIQRLVASGRLHPADRIWELWTRGAESLLFPALAGTASGLVARGPRARLSQAA